MAGFRSLTCGGICCRARLSAGGRLAQPRRCARTNAGHRHNGVSPLLSQIANQVSQQIIGENAKSSGSFNLAGELVTFNRADGNININITDAGTGAQTQIVIPIPAF